MSIVSHYQNTENFQELSLALLHSESALMLTQIEAQQHKIIAAVIIV